MSLEVVLAVARERGPWHRFSSAGVLPMLGLMSASPYLWHEPRPLHLAGDGPLPDQAASAILLPSDIPGREPRAVSRSAL